MSLWSSVKVFLVEAFWPWFKQWAWPIIREHLIEIIGFLMATISEKIKDKANKASEARVTEFEGKAGEAEKLAMDSIDKTEIEKLKSEARIWREVAEKLKKDNKLLIDEIESISNESKGKAIEILNTIDIDIDTDENNTILSIDGDSKKLPRIE